MRLGTFDTQKYGPVRRLPSNKGAGRSPSSIPLEYRGRSGQEWASEASPRLIIRYRGAACCLSEIEIDGAVSAKDLDDRSYRAEVGVHFPNHAREVFEWSGEDADPITRSGARSRSRVLRPVCIWHALIVPGR